jgi:ankyrin repeat protein
MDITLRVLDMQHDHDHQIEDDNIFDIVEPVLYIACKRGDLEAIKYIITSNGESPDIMAHDGRWAKPYSDGCLHIAARSGHLDIVKFLVESGADIDLRNSCGETALYTAIDNNHTKVAEYLIEKGADVNICVECDTFTDSCLLSAAAGGLTDIVKLLLDNGVGLYHIDKAVCSAICSGNVVMIKYMMNRFPKEICSNLFTKSDSPLFAAHSQTDIINFFLDTISDINEPDDTGWYPIHYVALYSNIWIMKELLKRGVRNDVLTSDGFDVYDILFLTGDEEMMEFFSRKNEIIN